MKRFVFSMQARIAPAVAALALVAGAGFSNPSTANAQTDAEKCQLTKAAASGKYASCLAGSFSKAIKKAEPRSLTAVNKCSSKVVAAYLKAEDKAGGACPSTGDATRQQTAVAACIEGVVTDLGGLPGPGGDEAKCQSTKAKEAGKYAACKFSVLSKAIKASAVPDFTSCEDKLAAKFNKLATATCSTSGDLPAVQADIDFCFNKVSASLEPTLLYAQDFEGLDPAAPGALSGDGYLVFANVFDPSGGYLYGYGPFAAPNGGAGFAGVDQNKGGFDQGTKHVVIYSDYNNADHGNGNTIEANVFQEFGAIPAGYVGKTLQWFGQYNRTNINDPASPQCADPNDPGYPSDVKAQAFIKTLDPNAGFAQSSFLTFNTTFNCNDVGAPWRDFLLELDIDVSLEGHILQVGFMNTATQYQSSGVVYDNLTAQLIDTP